jgi:ABC-type branched-subunit amino acid transport system ATPase component/ABC-type branched-subunit amino acid transport system permease subunit
MAAYYRLRPLLEKGAVALLLVLLVAWPWLAGIVLSNPTFSVSLVALTAVSVILTYSLNLAMGYTGMLSIVHTGFLALGGYASGALAINADLPVWVTLTVAVLLTAALGALIAAVSLRATYLYFGMITLSFNLLIVEIAREWEPVTGGFYGLAGIPRPSVLGQTLNARQLYLLIVAFTILAYLFHRNVIRSRSGRAFQAIRESSETASALGIRPGPTKILSFTLSGALAGLAGGLFAHQLTSITPEVGLLDNALIVFVGLLLGGVGTLAGPALGVGMVTIIDQLIKDLGQYRRLILGLVLLGAMIVIPKGIVGTWRSTRWGRDLSEDEQDDTVAGETPAAAAPPAQAAAPAAPRAEAEGEAGEPVVEAVGIVKTFGGVQALRGVDLLVRAREIHGVIGPNGSGKSTLMNVVTATFPPTDGAVRLFGRPAPVKPYLVAEAGVVRVFQKPHLFERVSVLENVLVGMHLRTRKGWLAAALRLPSFRAEEQALRQEALGYLELAGLRDRAHRLAGALSHGQKRLLEVVRAVAAQPKVLLLDEPATGLTRDELEALAGLVRRLQRMGLTVVLIEHNMEFLMDLADRLTVLDSGTVIATGTPAEVRASPQVQRAYLGSPELLEQTR